MSELPADAPAPRLCILVKWADFDGYGFNLHAEKSKAGQFIGKVDDDSPSEWAGLKEGDRIVEVNGVNIANENHRQVVERIKAVPSETRLLVVDEATDKWYKDRKLVVKSTQSNVLVRKTPCPRPARGAHHANSDGDPNGDLTPASEQNVSFPDEKHANDDGTCSEESPKLTKEMNDVNEEAERASTKDQNLNSQQKEEEVNSSRSTTPQEDNRSTPPVPDSPQSTKSGEDPDGPSLLADQTGNLNLNMSASEMRQLLASRKKNDPKKLQMDMRQKYNIVQEM